jgi:hypothetical protein
VVWWRSVYVGWFPSSTWIQCWGFGGILRLVRVEMGYRGMSCTCYSSTSMCLMVILQLERIAVVVVLIVKTDLDMKEKDDHRMVERRLPCSGTKYSM